MIGRMATGLLIPLVLLALWQAVIWLAAPPPFILPPPAAVFDALVARHALLARHGLTTLAEIIAGLGLGVAAGAAGATVMALAPRLRRLMLPAVVASQAIPVFALAPLLVLWLDYGMASKVAMAALIIFFPVLVTLLDGLDRFDPGLADLGQVMLGRRPGLAARLRLLRYLYGPAALPALGAGLRIAAAVAPIGAVIGEWVGAGRGLGWLMLQANARAQIDLMFAALLCLAVGGVVLFTAIDALARLLAPWAAGRPLTALVETAP